MKPKKTDWFKYCTICIEFINPRDGWNEKQWRDYAEEIVERAEKLGINTLAFDPFYGGRAIHQGSASPHNPSIGNHDIFGMVEKAVHRRKMKLVAFSMGMHFQPYAQKQYPAWIQRDAKGETVGYTDDWKLMCPNSPFGNCLIQEYGKLMARYPVDGLYIEGLYFGFGGCFCSYCQEKFKRAYGQDLLNVSGKHSPDHANFRANSFTDFVRCMRRTIDRQSPNTVWMASPSFFGDDWWHESLPYIPETDFAGWAPYVDVIHVERQWPGYPNQPSFPLRCVGQSLEIMRAETGKPVFGTSWISKNVDRNYSQRSEASFKLNFAQILMHGATPQIHIQNALEVDQSLVPTVKEMYGLVRKIRPYLLDSKPVGYAAILIDWTEWKPSRAFKGFFKVLTEAHIPFAVISREDLRQGKAAGYDVLILPDVGWIDAELRENIEAFAAEGGGVVMSYRTSGTNREGVLQREMTLNRLTGVRGPFGIVANPPAAKDLRYGIPTQNYATVTGDHEIGKSLRNRLLSFNGGYVEVEPLPSAQIAANVVDYDYSKMRSEHGIPGWYPAKNESLAPLIVTNQINDGGRVVFLTGQLDVACLEESDVEHFQLLVEAVRWAGNAPLPVEIDAPGTVEMTLHRDESNKRLLIFLLNQTTNQMYPDPPRFVVPLRDVEVRVRAKQKAESARTATGRKIKVSHADGQLRIQLPELTEYEAVMIDW